MISRQKLVARSVMPLLHRLWVGPFYRLRVEGLENVPVEGPCIVTPSHLGKLLADMTVLVVLLPRRVPVIIMPSLPGNFRWGGRRPWFGWMLRLGEWMMPSVRVPRAGGASSSVGWAGSLLKALKRGEAVILWPEGDVSWDGRLRPARPGAAWLALRSGAPVVPCGISGTYDVWPRWARRPHLTGRITVRFGQPFQLSRPGPGRIEPHVLEEASQRIMAEIGRLVDSCP